MATKKDLVEAYSFSRRRLTTAFLSGAPGGREVEPSRPGRTVIGGLALAVLLIAGAAIAAVLASRSPADWNQIGLVVTRGDQPATYVILEESSSPTLIPVINITSAQLILGADVKATSVDQSIVDEQTPGIPIGILGAPQTLPRPSQFVDTGWTACTDDRVGTQVDVSATERVQREPEAAVVVENQDQQWLIATSPARDRDRRTYRYLITPEVKDQFLTGFDLDQRSAATKVPQEWLALFPEGGALGAEGFGISDFGKPVQGGPAGVRVGDYVVDDSGQAGVYFDGGVQRLDEFSLALLQNLDYGDGDGPQPISGELPAEFADTTYAEAMWPDAAPEPLASPPCAQLDVDPEHKPYVWLAGSPDDVAVSPPTGAEGSIPADERRVTVDRGAGAFVLSGSWEQQTSDATLVVDPLGKVYPLVGGPITLQKLRYDKADAPLVPDEWLTLFEPGVALSTSAALCPPTPVDETRPVDECQSAPS